MAAKKLKKRAKAERATPIKERKDKSPDEQDNIHGGNMDFGGLPDRDLKKNLGGCG